MLRRCFAARKMPADPLFLRAKQFSVIEAVDLNCVKGNKSIRRLDLGAQQMTTEICLRRHFTGRNGVINFRNCLSAMRLVRKHYRAALAAKHKCAPFALTGINCAYVISRVRDLIDAERMQFAVKGAVWTANSDALDIALEARGITGSNDADRIAAIAAMNAGHFAVWDTYKVGPMNQFVSYINGGKLDEQLLEGSKATVYEALVAHQNDNILGTLFALNAEGEAFLRLAHAARAYRRNRAA
jgi:hypothetical protein